MNFKVFKKRLIKWNIKKNRKAAGIDGILGKC